MNYLDVTLNEKRYVQRTEYSKITVVDKENNETVYNSLTDLPQEDYELIKDYIKVLSEPEKYFEYKLLDYNVVITNFINHDLKHLVFPDEISGLPVTAVRINVQDDKLESVTFSNNIQNTNTTTFSNCSNLKTVNLSKNMTVLQTNMFKDCNSLETINTENLVVIQESALHNCTNLKNLNLEKIEFIENFAMCNCNSITSINLPNIRRICDYVFSQCEKLESVTTGDNLISLGQGAFYKCANLFDIKLSNCLKAIQNSTFKHCKSLKEFTFPNELLLIEKLAFYDTGLDSALNFPESLTTIEDNAFQKCNPSSISISSSTNYSATAFDYETLLKIKANKKTSKNFLKNIFSR